MSMYKAPVVVAVDDPMCSVTALNGTIVGVLFEKSGTKINEAIGKRIVIIDGEIKRLTGGISKVMEFIDEKAKELAQLDELYQERQDHKQAALAPFFRQLAEIRAQLLKVGHDTDLETDKIIAQHALKFQQKFSDIKPLLRDLEEFTEEPRFSGSVGSSSSSSHESSKSYLALSDDDDALNEQIAEAEDNALARITTLRTMVQKYSYAIETVKRRIAELENERRRLTLIGENIIDDHPYKLDLNQLSAFGFGD